MPSSSMTCARRRVSRERHRRAIIGCARTLIRGCQNVAYIALHCTQYVIRTPGSEDIGGYVS